MTKVAIKDKVLNLQAEIVLIMKTLEERPEFAIDEENWKKLKIAVKKTRQAVYKKTYAGR